MRRSSPLVYMTLIAAIALSVFPLYWLFVVATRGNDVVGDWPPPLVPGGNLGDNVTRLFAAEDANFLQGMVNSMIASLTVTVAVVFFSSLAGFAFAKLRFRGQNGLLLVILATMMIPVQMGIIPLYMIMVELGWQNRLQAVIVPFLVSAFGVFLMRQYAQRSVPDELVEAARVDGAGEWRVFTISLPLVRPGLGAVAVFTMLPVFNDLWFPLVLAPSEETRTVTLGAQQFLGQFETNWNAMLAALSLAILPVLVLYVVFSRQFLRGLTEGAIK